MMIDLHCHVLPAIDDGAESLDQSLEFCRIALADGITTLVATPHQKPGQFDNSPEAIREKVRELNVALREAGIDLKVVEGAEVYCSADVVGVELAAALKNIIALAAGVVEGLGFGSNTAAALLTRGLTEITRLGVACGGSPSTFSGLAGMGDLVLTCTGRLSRNRSVGIRLGEGRPLPEILAGMKMVAEGIPTTAAALLLARRHGVEMPITESMEAVLEGRLSPKDAVASLLRRPLKGEEAWG